MSQASGCKPCKGWQLPYRTLPDVSAPDARCLQAASYSSEGGGQRQALRSPPPQTQPPQARGPTAMGTAWHTVCHDRDAIRVWECGPDARAAGGR